jgi:hypothetical protein
LTGVSQQLYTDPEWYARIVEPPSVLGVEAITAAGITLRVWVVTAPGQQYAVRRELNRRVLLAFHASGITLGIPQQVVHAALPEIKEPPAPRDAKAAEGAKAKTADGTDTKTADGDAKAADGVDEKTPVEAAAAPARGAVR